MTGTLVKPQPVYLEADLEVVDDEAWEVAGLAVPFGEEYPRTHWESGAMRQRIDGATVLDGAQLFYGHDHLNGGLPIGLITEATPTDEGLRIRASISKTPKGSEVRTLLLDKVLTKFSVGYLDDVWHVEEDGALAVHDNVNVFETSVVPRPQLDGADVDTVLHNSTPPEGNPTMTDTLVNPEDITVLSDGLAAQAETLQTIERQIATLGSAAQGADAGHASGYQSYGEFLKGVASGAADAGEFLAFVGAVTGDLGGHLKDAWVGDLLRELEASRRLISFFGTSPLPKEGMNVEFGLVKPTSDTTQVAKQVAQGDTLAYGKIAFGTGTAPVETYGGWSDLARQVVDRVAAPVVEKFFKALYRRYLQTTEAAVRTIALNVANAVEVGSAVHDLATPDGWVDYAVDATVFLDDRGLALDGLLVGPDVFKDLAKMRVGAGGDYFLDRESGSIDVKGLSGDVLNVPVLLVPSAAADTVRGVSREAIDVWEDGAAPFRLQDADITNLTDAMSIYGYMAAGVTDSEGITRPNDGIA